MNLPEVLHIDADCLVINKPAGLAVHPGPRTPDSLERLLPEFCFGFKRLPQPVHRLDRDTSGCLLLARHPKALRQLSQIFEAHQVSKLYWAICAGTVSETAGVVDAPLAKISSREAGWRMVVSDKGKPARTRWQLLETDAQAQRLWMAFWPETGRTHQVRIHAAHLGVPLIGDPVYGPQTGAGPLRLHARTLSLPARPNRTALEVSAPLPEDWASLSFDFTRSVL